MRDARETLDKTCFPVLELIEEIEIKYKLQSTAEILLAQAESIQCRSQDALHKRNQIMTVCMEVIRQKVCETSWEVSE